MRSLDIPFPHHLLRLPLDWAGEVEIVEPQPVETVQDLGLAVEKALDAPVGAQPLERLAGPGSRVAVLVDDITRETPTAAMLPGVLARLSRAGVRDSNITLVMALGTHRPMTPEELRHKLGPAAEGYRIANDPADRTEQFMDLGRFRGGPVLVHRAVARADLRVGLGQIVPHMDAGFGGGAKIILPGACGAQTVDHFHSGLASVRGLPLGDVDTDLRRDLEAFVQRHAPLHHIVNSVPDLQGRMHALVAGHAVAAHRAGVALCLRVFGAPCSRPRPAVVAGAHPHHLDLWQATKSLGAAELVAEAGGAILLLAACTEGLGPHPELPLYMSMEPEDLARDILARKVSDPTAASVGLGLARLRKRCSLALYSPGLAQDALQEADIPIFHEIRKAADWLRSIGHDSLNVIPRAGVVLPLRKV